MARKRRSACTSGRAVSTTLLFVLLTTIAASAPSGLAQTTGRSPQAGETPSTAAAGSVSGLAADADGGLIQGAAVVLTGAGAERRTTTGADGRFSFTGVGPGTFQITVTGSGRASLTEGGRLAAGQALDVGALILHASANVDVEVLSPHAAAEVDVKQEEHQRILGFAPNFYVAYDFHAPALDARQKWELNWRTLVDPVNIALLAGQAGIEQETNAYSGFGPGPQGYGKRFGAAYADFATANSLAGWILPIVFKQDPRYFYLGKGSTRHRLFYAVSTSVIARGDNGRWQPAYANVLGSLGAGAVANLYYPAANRTGAGLTFASAGLSIGFDAVSNVLQEFVFRHVSTGAKQPQH